METGGLSRVLELKVNSRVMLTSNIDVLDKLSNGQILTVFHINPISTGGGGRIPPRW